MFHSAACPGRRHDEATETYKTMTRYVAYYRVSTKKQGVSGLGLDAQRDSVKTFLRGQTVIAEFEEVESGKRSDRPKLAEAFALCKRKKATLVIAKLDRLARNVAFIANLMEAGVPFVACDMPTATDFTIHIYAAIAQHEAKIISERTKAGLASAKRDLALNGSRVSKYSGKTYTQLGKPENIKYLLAADRKRKVPQQVKDIILAANKEGLTLQAIADRLNGSGIKTPQSKTWWPQSIKNQLKGA